MVGSGVTPSEFARIFFGGGDVGGSSINGSDPFDTRPPNIDLTRSWVLVDAAEPGF